MNWTIQPLPTIDTLNRHEGFYVVITLFLCVFLVTIFVKKAFQAERDDEYISVCSVISKVRIFFVISLALSGIVSYNTGEVIVPENVEGKATFLGYTDSNFDSKNVWLKYKIENEDTIIFLLLVPNRNVHTHIKVWGN